MTPAPPAPLETTDPQRAEALKRKVLDRIKDVRRHLCWIHSRCAAYMPAMITTQWTGRI